MAALVFIYDPMAPLLVRIEYCTVVHLVIVGERR